jgi:c-di-GMP-binding flagellar brake protein YcgR
MSNHNERRRHQRHTVSYEITVAPDESREETKTEYLHDISDGGIHFNELIESANYLP